MMRGVELRDPSREGALAMGPDTRIASGVLLYRRHSENIPCGKPDTLSR